MVKVFNALIFSLIGVLPGPKLAELASPSDAGAYCAAWRLWRCFLCSGVGFCRFH